MSVVPSFWLTLMKELIWGVKSEKARSRSLGDIFMVIVRMAMAWTFFVVVTQQCALINSRWSEKLVQHEQAVNDYKVHQCGYMKTTNIPFINECERLSIVMRISPLMAAITSVINGWNSCITMPCTQVVHMVLNHYEYKLLFSLISFGFLYYAYKFFNTGCDKTIVLQDMIRAELTRKYQGKNK